MQGKISSYFSTVSKPTAKRNSHECIIIDDDDVSQTNSLKVSRADDSRIMDGPNLQIKLSTTVDRQHEFACAIRQSIENPRLCLVETDDRKSILTPLENQVQAIRLKQPDCILMVQCGYRMRFFGDDASIAAKILGIMCHRDHSFMVASIPTYRVAIHCRRLIANGYKVAIVRQTETAAIRKNAKQAKTIKSSATFSREIVGIFCPSTQINEDDPAFRDLLTFSGPNQQSEALSDGDDDEDHTDVTDSNVVESTQEQSSCMLISINESPLPSHIIVIGILQVDLIGHCMRFDLMECGRVEGVVECGRLVDLIMMWQPTEILVQESALCCLVTPLQSVLMNVTDKPGCYKPMRITGTPSHFYNLNNIPGDVSARLAQKFGLHHAQMAALAACYEWLRQLGLALPQHDASITCTRVSLLDASHNNIKTSFCLDGITARDLEVFECSRFSRSESEFFSSTKHDSFSLYGILQEYCCSLFGRRMLRNWLMNPLVCSKEILKRQSTVQWFMHQDGVNMNVPGDKQSSCCIFDEWVAKFLSAIKSMRDVEQSLTSLHSNRMSPMKLVSLLKQMIVLRELLLDDTESSTCLLCRDLPVAVQLIARGGLVGDMSAACDEVLSALRLSAADTNDVSHIFSSSTLSKYPVMSVLQSKLAAAQDNMKAELSRIQKELRQPNLNFRTLRISAVTSLEYLIELPIGTKVANDWIKISATKQFERYHTPVAAAIIEELALLKDELKIAADNAWKEFIVEVDSRIHEPMRRAVAALTELDVLHAFSRLAQNPGFVIPTYATCAAAALETTNDMAQSEMIVLQARHPIAERVVQSLGKSYVPNDIELRCCFGNKSSQIITGPNMGGKSCYAKMVAIIALLGQIGCAVPAASARLCIFDNFFTRIGAGDDLASGQSSFMLELSRTSHILRTASSRSLVILDELGRGTSTHDGMAIALATLTHITKNLGCCLLFVTHYHCPQLYDSMYSILYNKVFASHMDFMKLDDANHCHGPQEIVFLYKMINGSASGSFGLNVARLAGFDEEFINLAAQKSKWMESIEWRK